MQQKVTHTCKTQQHVRNTQETLSNHIVLSGPPEASQRFSPGPPSACELRPGESVYLPGGYQDILPDFSIAISEKPSPSVAQKKGAQAFLRDLRIHPGKQLKADHPKNKTKQNYNRSRIALVAHVCCWVFRICRHRFTGVKFNRIGKGRILADLRDIWRTVGKIFRSQKSIGNKKQKKEKHTTNKDTLMFPYCSLMWPLYCVGCSHCSEHKTINNYNNI